MLRRAFIDSSMAKSISVGVLYENSEQ